MCIALRTNEAVMCECANLNYTDDNIYPRLPNGYPQSYEQGYLPLAGGCGILTTLEVEPANGFERVELSGRFSDGDEVGCMAHLRDPELRELYAPYISGFQGQAVCGR
jgi:hypothetical protein